MLRASITVRHHGRCLSLCGSGASEATDGALGTWARDFVGYFSLRGEFYQVLKKKLVGTEEEQSYVALFFWYVLPHTFSEPINDWTRAVWVKAICEAVSNPFGSSILKEKLTDNFYRLPDNWRTQILAGLKPLEESDSEYYASLAGVSGDDIPF